MRANILAHPRHTRPDARRTRLVEPAHVGRRQRREVQPVLEIGIQAVMVQILADDVRHWHLAHARLAVAATVENAWNQRQRLPPPHRHPECSKSNSLLEPGRGFKGRSFDSWNSLPIRRGESRGEGFFRFHPGAVVPYWSAVPKRWLILVVLVFGLLLVLYLTSPTPPEPSYKGRTLTEWCAIYCTAKTSPEAPKSDLRAEAANAIRRIGSNAVPYLLKAIECAPADHEPTLQALAEKAPQFLSTISDIVTARYHERLWEAIYAANAFAVVGGVPQETLTRLTNPDLMELDRP